MAARNCAPWPRNSEHERDTWLAKYHQYEFASAAFQIGIVLASAAVITGMVALAWLAALAGILALSSWHGPIGAARTPSGRALAAHASAVDVQRLPGDEGGVVAGQERDRADQIVRHFRRA